MKISHCEFELEYEIQYRQNQDYIIISDDTR